MNTDDNPQGIESGGDMKVAGDVVAGDKHIHGDEVHGDKIVVLPSSEHEYSFRSGDPTQPRRPVEHYIHRPALMRRLRTALGLDGDGASNTVAITALQGIGGVGKTVLAQALTSEPGLKARFPEGLLWATLGPEVRAPNDADEMLADWLLALGDDPRRYPAVKAKAAAVRDHLVGQHRLLVLDDVWYYEPADLLRSTRGNNCSVLITSRERDLAVRLGAARPEQCVDVDALDEDEALALVQKLLGEQDEAVWEGQIKAVLKRLGWHALAVRLAAQQVASKAYTWREMDQKLAAAGLAATLDDRNSAAREQSLRVTFRLSTDALAEGLRRRFAWLGALARAAEFTALDAGLLWTGLEPETDEHERRIQIMSKRESFV